MFHSRAMAALAALGWLTWLGCASGNSADGAKMTITITSEAFQSGAAIPKRFTSDGEDRSPPLAWSGVPGGAKELALICDDPDAPAKEPWVHWVLYKIPAGTKSLPEGAPRKDHPAATAGALDGINSWENENTGYRGPAPPPGKLHHYHFHLYALDAPLDLKPGLDKNGLLAAVKGHILAEGELIGTYQR